MAAKTKIFIRDENIFFGDGKGIENKIQLSENIGYKVLKKSVKELVVRSKGSLTLSDHY